MRSRAMACSGAVPIRIAVADHPLLDAGAFVTRLPVPLAEHAVAYGRASLGPLLWAMDEYERTLIVVVDQERARFISGYMGGASREGAQFGKRDGGGGVRVRGRRVARPGLRESLRRTLTGIRRPAGVVPG